MPFPTPTIRIRLTGLLVFYFTQDTANPPNITGCRIGIHNGSDEHKLRVNVHEITPPNQGPTTANLILELFNKAQGSDINLTVINPDPIAQGIILAPSTTPPFNTTGPNELEFSLIPNLAGADFHNKILPNNFNHFITLNNGVFYTRVKKEAWILREKGQVATFKPMMGIEAGINIYLQDSPSSKAVLSCGNKTLEITKAANVLNEIQIFNDCPMRVSSPLGFFESDFKLYYEKISPDFPDDQFTVIFQDKGVGGPGPLNVDHPCGPIKGG